MKRNSFKGRRRRKNDLPLKLLSYFSMIELLLVISIIAILASLLLPVLNRARDSAQQSACRSNLKQLGAALAGYTVDSDDYFHFSKTERESSALYKTWTMLYVQNAYTSAKLFLCGSRTPDSETKRNYRTRLKTFTATTGKGWPWHFPDYGYNHLLGSDHAGVRCSQGHTGVLDAGVRVGQVRRQSGILAFGESREALTDAAPANPAGYFMVHSRYSLNTKCYHGYTSGNLFPVHGVVCNTVFVDGHTAAYRALIPGIEGGRSLYEQQRLGNWHMSFGKTENNSFYPLE